MQILLAEKDVKKSQCRSPSIMVTGYVIPQYARTSKIQFKNSIFWIFGGEWIAAKRSVLS
jgi:hypothetical protein